MVFRIAKNHIYNEFSFFVQKVNPYFKLLIENCEKKLTAILFCRRTSAGVD